MSPSVLNDQSQNSSKILLFSNVIGTQSSKIVADSIVSTCVLCDIYIYFLKNYMKQNNDLKKCFFDTYAAIMKSYSISCKLSTFAVFIVIMTRTERSFIHMEITVFKSLL